jgi:5-methylthioadenosine/S-adenosylhomocysteine deaminase
MNHCSAPLDILIRGGRLLTFAEDNAIIEDPLIGIRDGEILFIEEAHAPLVSLYAPKEVINAEGSVILPGLINTHTHVPMVCFRGLADDLPLMEWLNKHIFPAERRHVNREMVYAGAMLGIAEMLLSGTTTFCDGYFFESSVAQAALKSGIRCVAGMGFLDEDVQLITEGQIKRHMEAAEKFIVKWTQEKAMITPALFCHSPYTCSSETIRAVKDISGRHGVPFLIHVAETRDERGIIDNRYGCTPVNYLNSLGVMDGMTVAVHCNWVDEGEIDCLAANRVKVSHNPQSNMKLAAGVAPIPEMLAAGIDVGLGTDGCASNNDHDMFGEMDSAAKLHKVIKKDPSIMDAHTVLKMATRGGARVLGLDRLIGSIEVGKKADLIIVDLNKPHLTPVYNICSQLVYAASGADVQTSIINGRIVMKDRRLLTIDLEEVMDTVDMISHDIRNSLSQ